LIVDWLTSQFRITPCVVDWNADTVLSFAGVGGTSIVIVTLSIDNTSDTTLGLVTFSKPFCLVIVGKQNKVGVEKGSILCARNWRISASERFSISRRSAHVGGAFVAIVTSCKMSAESIVWQADILCAWVVVITIGVVATFWCWNATF